MLAKQAGEDGDEEDWEEDDAEETALEGYTTTIDDEDNFVDEYQIFKATLQSKIIRFVVHPSRSVHVECFVSSDFTATEIQTLDPAWYQALTQALDEEQRKHLQDIGTLADQRRAAHGEYQLRPYADLNIPRYLNTYPTTSTLITESKMIEKHGGYKFTAPVVPSSFNFGGSAPGMN